MNNAMRDGYRISTDSSQVQIDAVHAYLSRAYWCEGIPRETIVRAVQNSLCISIFAGNNQVSFARVLTDKATHAYLCDVYVLEEHRGKGLSKWIMEQVLAHPDLQGLRRFVLATRDAHGLYAQFGFSPLKDATRFMEINRPGIYKR